MFNLIIIMNKRDIVRCISARTGLTVKDSDKAVSAFLEEVIDTVTDGEKVTLVGFGTFDVRKRKEREGRNPQSGESMTIPAATVPHFSPGTVFKRKVNGD